MCSVVTNLVTSLEFQPIRCAVTLFHLGRTRNGYVAARIILLSSTAESSATSGYVVAPERSGQSEPWASRNVERVRKKPSLVPTVDLIDAVCNHMQTWTFLAIVNFFSVLWIIFLMFFSIFLLWKIRFIFCLCFLFVCRRGNNHIDVQFWRIGPVLFPSKKGKDAVREGRNGRKGVYFPQKLAFFPYKFYD